MMGVLGRLDDIALGAYLVYRYFRAAQRIGSYEQEDQRTQHTSEAKGSAGPSQEPHSVLGVEKGAKQEEIREAYRRKMSEYHPDKVRHLGAELQKLAHEKSLAIQKAYEILKERGSSE